MSSLRLLLNVPLLNVLLIYGQQNESNVEVYWFEQKLDHFDPQNTKKWKQRYFVNDAFYKSGGQPFLFVGGESEVQMSMVTDFAWVNYAKHFGALCFALEHRYFGESWPVEDMSLPNLKYMNTHQALADLATFINGMNEKYNLSSDTKWIAFGASYPGALATWLRIKYPHLVYAVVASSPAINLRADYGDYITIGLKSYELHSKKCMSVLQQGASQLDKHLETAAGRRVIDKKLDLCTPLEKSATNSRDIGTLFYNLVSSFAAVAQNDVTYNNSESIREICEHITAADNDLDGLAAGNSYLLKTTNSECLDFLFKNVAISLKNTSRFAKPKNDNIYERVYEYLLCNEMGAFITSSTPPQLFGNRFPLEYRTLECQYAFGEQYDASFVTNAIKTTNLLYGGTDMVISNVLFVQGTADPWLNTQYSAQFKSNLPSIIIQGTTHAEDIYPETREDPPKLKRARAEIVAAINKWLNL